MFMYPIFHLAIYNIKLKTMQWENIDGKKNNNNNNMQFLYSAFSLLNLAQSALHIIAPGRPVTSIT